MIIDHYKKLLEKIKTFLDHGDNLRNKVNNNPHYRLHVIIYFVLIKSNRKNEYLKFMKNFAEFKISEFPANVNILDISNLNFPKYSEYDGEPINQKIEKYQTFEEIDGILEKHRENYIPISDKKNIMVFLNEMVSRKKVKEVITYIKTHKEIQKWNFFIDQEGNRIIINADTLDEYKNLLQEVKDLKNQYFIIIRPPYNIDEKSIFVARKLNVKYEAKLFKEMLNIIDIRILLKAYPRKINLGSHFELRSMIHVFNEYNKPLSDRVYKIVHKITGGNKAKFENILFSKKHVYKNSIELAFASIFNKNFRPIKIKEITKLGKKPEGKYLIYFLRIANNIIGMHENKNTQNEEYNDLIKGMEKQEPNYWTRRIDDFKTAIVYNYIVTKEEIFLYERIEPMIIVGAIKNITDIDDVMNINDSMPKYDKKISDLIDKINPYEGKDETYNLIISIQGQRLGKKVKNVVFENLKIFLKNISEAKYNAYKVGIKKFIKKLDDKQQKEIYKIMRKIQ